MQRPNPPHPPPEYGFPHSPAAGPGTTIDVAGNKLRILTDSTTYATALVADIRAARRRVWIESYIVADDAVGKAVAAALADRAALGVDCRLMYDYVGCSFTPSAYFRDLRAAGVRVHAFHAWRQLAVGWRFLSLFNQRNHRKLCVIDNRIAYFGGMNIVDQRPLATVSDVAAQRLPPSAGWRDVHVRLEGPSQVRLAVIVGGLWRQMLKLPGRASPRWQVRRMLSRARDQIGMFDTHPGLRPRRAAKVLVPSIDRARRRITVAMAYFIPQGRVLRALLRARRRGVTVRVIVPEKSDVPIVRWCSRHLYGRLLRHGIRLYERRDEMLHSKVLTIDDDWTVVGSCNLDPRSLRTNLEFLSVVRSREFNAAVKRICAHDLRASRRVRDTDYSRRHWVQRLLDRLAWILRRWL